MNSPLSKLSLEEKEELSLIPVWVSILIAGADNNFSRKEIKRAVKLTMLKQKDKEKFIVDFYRDVSKKFEVNLKGYISLMPKDVNKRTEFLVGKITKVNDLFNKIDIE